MNTVALLGRLTRDPDVRYTQGNEPLCVARYTLAVDRGTKDKDGKNVADFIQCIAMGRNGEFAEKYLKKGKRYAITGRWQTGSYTNKEGVKVYTNECYVTHQDFADGVDGKNDWQSIPDGIDENLPFM